MPRPRLMKGRPLSAAERVARHRSRHRRQEVMLDLVEGDQVARFAERWDCPRQEVLKIAFRACLPAAKKARSAQDLFNRVRDALEASGLK